MAILPKLNTMEFDKEIPFEVSAPFEPMGDQPRAIRDLAAGIENGQEAQVLPSEVTTQRGHHALGMLILIGILSRIEGVGTELLLIVAELEIHLVLRWEIQARLPESIIDLVVGIRAIASAGAAAQ